MRTKSLNPRVAVLAPSNNAFQAAVLGGDVSKEELEVQCGSASNCQQAVWQQRYGSSCLVVQAGRKLEMSAPWGRKVFPGLPGIRCSHERLD